MVIAQLFDKPFALVTKMLASLQRLGITHVLVSPPQKSHSDSRWWGRYQPVDFTCIEGPLGDGHQLYTLCQSALGRGMVVVVDTVLHHLSNESQYIHIRGSRIVWAQYPWFSKNDLSGLHRLGRGKGLPILDTNSSWVRSQLRDYLHFLFEHGVRGFRFDSAKHMDSHFFADILSQLPPLFNFGELVYSDPDNFPSDYWRSMKAYDFPLAMAVSKSFAFNGNLSELINPKSLWGPHAVSFVNHHDLARNRSGFAHFRIPDLRDRQLAYAYLLTRPHGTPLVYGPDLRHREVKAALKFRMIVQGSGFAPVLATPNVLAIQRGNRALMAINKAAEPYSLELSLEPGLYRELITGWQASTRQGRLHWTLAPRSATLLHKID